ncbi:MAG: RNA polymerase sigma factor [Azoarcus sp.]|nr:RNA polymerase sigma factor [Azoarcus sp.]
MDTHLSPGLSPPSPPSLGQCDVALSLCPQAALLDYLEQHYHTLKQRLTRRLGCAELAGDALHDTWLRLKGSEDQGLVHEPGAYLTRMAINLVVDAQRRNSRLLSGDEVDALIEEFADPAPGPEDRAEIRSDVQELAELLDRMPKRRRAVALLVMAEGMTQKEAARRLGVSLRTVEYELQRVHERLNAHLARRE